MDKSKRKSVDAIALKRKLSEHFNKRFVDEDGNISYEKLKEAEKELKLSKNHTRT